MPSLYELQAALRDAILAPGAASPEALSGLVQAQRLGIHRTNTSASLREALAALYPVTERLVGTAFFSGLAQAFVPRQPPASPALLDYGAAFPRFLETFPPALQLPYLADVARLELAWHQVYHAADADPVLAADLAAIDRDRLPALRLHLHPASRLLRSDYPVDLIWRVNQPGFDGDTTLDLGRGGCFLLVIRPELSVEIRSLDAGAFAFLEALRGGATLGEAWHRATASDAAFDVQVTLRDLAAGRSFAGFEAEK